MEEATLQNNTRHLYAWSWTKGVNLFCFINYIRDWVTISVFLECQSVEDNFMWTKNKESHDSFAVIIASLWYLHMYIVTKKGPCEATMMISFLTLYISVAL